MSSFQLVKDNSMSKGDVLTVGEIAGVCGAKKTSDLIPLCHPISLNSVRVKLELDEVSNSHVCKVFLSIQNLFF